MGLLSNLGLISMLWILPGYCLLFLGSMAAAALAGRKASFLAHWNALLYCAKNLKKIRHRRTITRKIRKVSDQWIFSKVMRMPRLEYFLKTFQQKLADYEDPAI